MKADSDSVLVPGNSLPRFWIFMYRVSPFTYLVEGMLGVGVGQTSVVCSDNEYLRFQSPNGETCGNYMSTWINNYGGYLLDPNSQGECEFCAIQSTDTFLAQFNISYGNK